MPYQVPCVVIIVLSCYTIHVWVSQYIPWWQRHDRRLDRYMSIARYRQSTRADRYPMEYLYRALLMLVLMAISLVLFKTALLAEHDNGLTNACEYLFLTACLCDGVSCLQLLLSAGRNRARK